MKLNKLPLFLIPVLLMSCGGVSSLTIEEGKEIVNNFVNASYSSYVVDASIQIAAQPISENQAVEQFTLLENPDNGSTLAENIFAGLVSSSYYLGAPLKLTSTNFYLDETDSAKSVYGIIRSLIIYATGSTSSLVLKEAENGGIIFAAYNSGTALSITNVNNQTFDNYDDQGNYVSTEIQRNVSEFAGRINAEYEYNNEGYLIRETAWSINYNKAEAATNESMLYLESTYTYNV